MRCKNCGWENPEANRKCEKCNAPLSGSIMESSSKHYSSIAAELKGTVPETGSRPSYKEAASEPSQAGNGNACPQCSYPVSPEMNVCPMCGESLKQSVPRAEASPAPKCPKCGMQVSRSVKFCPSCGAALRMGTVNAWETPRQGGFCTLKPIAWKGEEVTYSPISYSGDMISLNRTNTDPNNNTITSKEQAILIHEHDAWYIEDRSEQHTTLIRVGKKTRLENGDIIVLGNRMFEFKG